MFNPNWSGFTRKATPAGGAPQRPSWPWETASAEIPPTPLLAAVPYRPITPEDVSAAVDAHAHVREGRDHLNSILERAYRNPAKAAERLAALEQKGGAEAVAGALAARPDLLGRLRGSSFFLAINGNAERAMAELFIRYVGTGLVALRSVEAEMERSYRFAEEPRRQAASVEVPALSEKARLALEALCAAGGDPGWQWSAGTQTPTAKDAACARRIAPVWAAIRSDPALRRELTGFDEAVDMRWPLGPEPAPGAEDPASTALRHHPDPKRSAHPAFQAAVVRSLRGGRAAAAGGGAAESKAGARTAPRGRAGRGGTGAQDSGRGGGQGWGVSGVAQAPQARAVARAGNGMVRAALATPKTHTECATSTR